MPHSCDTVALAADGVSATIALRGAEPLSWRVAGRELIWHGDPAHWPQRAPILFPVIGASAGGAVRVEGRSYPMPRHGFARDLPFGLVERRPDRARLRLRATSGTLRHYPFRFELGVEAGLTADRLSLRFTVTNAETGRCPMGSVSTRASPGPSTAAPASGIGSSSSGRRRREFRTSPPTASCARASGERRSTAARCRSRGDV
jgi:D-hexose-6-phosphate mutarotase